MKSAIRVFGILNIIFGALSILGAMFEIEAQSAVMAFVGGAYVLTNGILMTIYTRN